MNNLTWIKMTHDEADEYLRKYCPPEALRAIDPERYRKIFLGSTMRATAEKPQSQTPPVVADNRSIDEIISQVKRKFESCQQRSSGIAAFYEENRRKQVLEDSRHRSGFYIGTLENQCRLNGIDPKNVPPLMHGVPYIPNPRDLHDRKPIKVHGSIPQD